MSSAAELAVRVGVLALQGNFAAHTRVLERLGVEARQIRRPSELDGLDALIIPGGESTTLRKLMEGNGFETAIVDFHDAGGALFGTCAGLILLARKVTSPVQRSLGLIDVEVERNAYGRQLDSVEATASWAAPELLGNDTPLPLVFIRAPLITRRDPAVESLVVCRGDVVCARQGRILVSSFHPEMSEDDRVHRFFLRLVQARRTGEKGKEAGSREPAPCV